MEGQNEGIFFNRGSERQPVLPFRHRVSHMPPDAIKFAVVQIDIFFNDHSTLGAMSERHYVMDGIRGDLFPAFGL